MFKQLKFKNFIKYLKIPELSEIYYYYSDHTSSNSNNDSLIKYIIGPDNITKIVNPDLITIYNKIISKLQAYLNINNISLENLYTDDDNRDKFITYFNCFYEDINSNLVDDLITDIYIYNDNCRSNYFIYR